MLVKNSVVYKCTPLWIIIALHLPKQHTLFPTWSRRQTKTNSQFWTKRLMMLFPSKFDMKRRKHNISFRSQHHCPLNNLSWSATPLHTMECSERLADVPASRRAPNSQTDYLTHNQGEYLEFDELYVICFRYAYSNKDRETTKNKWKINILL